jgi:hypothetical protein
MDNAGQGRGDVKIAVLGTGIVGRTLGSKLVEVGNSAMMGSRSANSPKAAEWVEAAGALASQGTFADAAAFGEVVLNCTAGVASLEALELAGRENLSGKILMDVANPLDFSQGMPPTLTVCNTDSLGERIQRAFPDAKVVKALNTLNCAVMARPELVPGEHHVFVSGDDAEAKGRAAGLLGEWFGWEPRDIIDLGGIGTARGTEMMLPLWISLMGTLGTPIFNLRVVTGRDAPSA